jgi:DNA-directed RNA polymerase specialized sigma24 family protein
VASRAVGRTERDRVAEAALTDLVRRAIPELRRALASEFGHRLPEFLTDDAVSAGLAAMWGKFAEIARWPSAKRYALKAAFHHVCDEFRHEEAASRLQTRFAAMVRERAAWANAAHERRVEARDELRRIMKTLPAELKPFAAARLLSFEEGGRGRAADVLRRFSGRWDKNTVYRAFEEISNRCRDRAERGDCD